MIGLSPSTVRRWLFSPWLGAAVLVGMGALLFGSTGQDDAYITYWAADQLAATGRIVNYNGAAVEQSSSMLHTALLAAVALLTPLSVPAAGLVVGVLAGVGTVLLTARAAESARAGAALPAALVVGSGAYLVYWSLGGLETALAAAVLCAVALSAASVVERGMTWRAGTAFGAAAAMQALVRPEGGLVLLAGLLGAGVLLVRSVKARWRVAGLLGMTIGVVLLVVLARLAWFGVPVPQPVRSKFGGLDLVTLDWGLAYARKWLLGPEVLVLLAVAVFGALLRDPDRRPIEALLWALAAAQTAAAVLAGGDWMLGGRLLVPGLALVGALAGVAFVRIRRRAGNRAAMLVAGVLVVAQLAGLGLAARVYSTGQPIWTDDVAVAGVAPDVLAQFSWLERRNRVHLRDAAFLPGLLTVVEDVHHRLGRPVVVASGQAGMVAYYLMSAERDQVRFVDLFSLTGDDFAGCPDLAVRTRTGSSVGYRAWLASLDACRAPEPDVIFDLDRFEPDVVSSGRYQVVHRVAGSVLRSPSTVFRGIGIDPSQFVAVRVELAGSASAAVGPPP